MSADDLLNILTYALYIGVFAVAIWRLIRRPTRANLDAALLFGATATIIVIALLGAVFGLHLAPVAVSIIDTLLMALPYLTLRLVEDFAVVRRPVMRLAEVGLLIAAVALFVLPQPVLGFPALAMVAYFVVVESYAAIMFVRQAQYSNGITHRRMQTIAAGTLLVGMVILLAGVAIVAPATVGAIGILSHLCGLASGLCYSIGFTPPAFLRRSWHEPELRAFLAQSVRLSQLGSLSSVIQELELGAAAAAGAPNATIGMWDPIADLLRYRQHDDTTFEHGPDELIAGRAFTSGHPVFSSDARRDDPTHADLYEAREALAVLAAPITWADKRVGVLAIFAPRAPIFADDDLALVQLLADHAALILESCTLLEEAARVQAREETARLKEDFLSSAAHDLKSPLTGILGQAQVMELRARRHPEVPADLQAIQRIIGEAQRMRRLITSLLDAARADGGMLGTIEPVDLGRLADEICRRRSSAFHPCVLDAQANVIGDYDRMRIEQLLENLLENAAKYSPGGGEICVRLWREQGEAHLTVTDRGIGIPAADLPRLFDRFHRGSNVDDRRFVGMGLGLYICRRIAEQHGGAISASSPGADLGATIHVVLPVASRSDTANVIPTERPSEAALH